MASKGGRPTKLTDEAWKTFMAELRRCGKVHVAAKSSGLGARTVFRWLEMGRKGKSPRHVKFWRDTEKTRAEVEADCLENIIAAKDGWQSSGWMVNHLNKHNARSDEMAAMIAAALETGDKDALVDAHTTAMLALMRQAHRRGEIDTCIKCLDKIAELQGLRPSDKAAIARAGLDKATVDHGSDLRQAIEAITSKGGSQSVVMEIPTDGDVGGMYGDGKEGE